MRIGDHKDITILGRTVLAQYLGKGQFSKAYRVGGHVYVFTNGCMMKDMLTRCNPMKHIPVIEHVETQPAPRRPQDTEVYRMPFYEPLLRTSPATCGWSPWAIWQQLKEVRRDAWNKVFGGPVADDSISYRGVDVSWECCEIASRNTAIPATITQALYEMQSTMADYGSGHTFEFCRQANFKIGPDSELILLDVCYDAEGIVKKLNTKLAQQGQAHRRIAFL